MPNILKTYSPSNTNETLCGNDFKDALNSSPVYVYLDGKYFVLECVVFSDKVFMVAGKEIKEGDL